jgi:hypothetical protein
VTWVLTLNSHTIMNGEPASVRNRTSGSFKRVFNPSEGIYNYYYNDRCVGDSNESGYAFEMAIWSQPGDYDNFNFERRKQGKQGINFQKTLIQKLTEEGKNNLIPSN